MEQGRAGPYSDHRSFRLIFAEVAAPEPPTPSSEGALYSEFSIGYGKVRFSRGNLQYQASTGTWRFAENQYDVIGYDNSAISSTNEGWIDLFGWGTGDNPTNISTDCSTYSTFTDWGVNAISNGGNKGGLWRTMSENEWEYIFNYHSWAKASVNDVNGFIILPDDFVLPFGVNWTEQTTNWRTNKYSIDDWVKMEMAGAVFLPAAGARERETNTYSVGTYAYYWTKNVC